jgi:hypothetical protein
MEFVPHNTVTCRHCSHFGTIETCHRICKLPQCRGSIPHDFKTCHNRKICSQCNRGGHTQESCRIPICDFCKRPGHTQNSCDAIANAVIASQNAYGDYITYLLRATYLYNCANCASEKNLPNSEYLANAEFWNTHANFAYSAHLAYANNVGYLTEFSEIPAISPSQLTAEVSDSKVLTPFTGEVSKTNTPSPLVAPSSINILNSEFPSSPVQRD